MNAKATSTIAILLAAALAGCVPMRSGAPVVSSSGFNPLARIEDCEQYFKRRSESDPYYAEMIARCDGYAYSSPSAAAAFANYHAARAPDVALAWQERAARMGDAAMAFLIHRAAIGGSAGPQRGTAFAAEILELSASRGHAWALATRIAALPDPRSSGAIELLRQGAAGVADDCEFQLALGLHYLSGDAVTRDPVMATFWFRRAGHNANWRSSNVPRDLSLWTRSAFQTPDGAAGLASGRDFTTCSAVITEKFPEAGRALAEVAAIRFSESERQSIDRLVSEWRPGSPEPKVANISVVPPSAAPAQSAPLPASIPTPRWIPAKARTVAAAGRILVPTDVFERSEPSVWVVRTSASGQPLSQGSAVAISRSTLLTNCHVLRGAGGIAISRGRASHPARLLSGDDETDRCVIETSGTLVPVEAVREFASLRVGEAVYAIGSPQGLENTLSPGIVSGLRNSAGQRLVQTTAPFSPGSSGGALFDAGGYLVGITTFLLRGEGGIYFAIPATSFLDPR
jgi:S1-C subfamily serine protease